MKARMVWLARDPYEDADYELHLRRPGARALGLLDYFCPEHFERVTRYKLKPGECKRVRIVVEEV